MKINNLNDLIKHSIVDIYSAEKQVADTLPKLIDASSNVDLRNAFTTHLSQTRAQIKRLEESAELLGVGMGETTCKGMEGILSEGKELVDQIPEGIVRDHAIVASALKVAHYEMASYLFLISHLEALEEDDVVSLLHESLMEEEEASNTLVSVHDSVMNQEDLREEL